METIYINTNNLAYLQQKARPNVMALGFFDGFHKGHLEVMKTAVQKAKERNLLLSVMSFFPHPKTVLSKGKKQVNYLMPLSEKEKMLQKLGVETFYVVDFDQEFSKLSPEQFAAQYLIGLGVVHAVAGFDYTYGFRGEGNMDRLKIDSGGLLEVTKVSKVECQGEKISSTCIREKLSIGNVEKILDLLERPYEVKCDWDGYSLKVRPFYTLPAPGKYAVTIVNNNHSQLEEGIVVVTEKKELISPLFISGVTLKNKEGLTIIWHHRIFEENTHSFSKNYWIDASLNGSVQIV